MGRPEKVVLAPRVLYGHVQKMVKAALIRQALQVREADLLSLQLVGRRRLHATTKYEGIVVGTLDNYVS